MVNVLTMPKVDDLMKECGTGIFFPDHVKWAEIASKTNIIFTTATPALKNQMEDKIVAVQNLQGGLSEVLQKAFIRALHKSVLEAQNAMKSVLQCHELLVAAAPKPKIDWQAHSQCLQKVLNMNFRILIGFDIQGVLGTDCGKHFLHQIDRTTRLFEACCLAADWMIHSCRGV